MNKTIRIKATSQKMVSLLFALIFFFSANTGSLYAATAMDKSLDADQILAENPDIPMTNVSGKPLNKTMLSKTGFVVYGQPHGNFSPHAPAERRYLGYTYQDAPFENPNYPPDLDATKDLDKTWVKEPWRNTTVKNKWNIKDWLYNDEPDAKIWLRDRLRTPYTHQTGYTLWLEDFNNLPGNSWHNHPEDPTPWDAETLLNYGVIYTKPTKYAPGLFRMFNTNGEWYQTFLIDPDVVFGEELDLYVSFVEGGNAQVGSNHSTRVTVGLSQNSVRSVTDVPVTFTYGSQSKTTTISLNPGEEKNLTFDWNVSSNPGTLTLKAEINPEPRSVKEFWDYQDDVYANNIKAVNFEIIDRPTNNNGDCGPGGNYASAVIGTYTYKGPPCDESGCSTYIGYYYEHLEMDMDSPDPEVVQAGQGTEVKVRTYYWNDDPSQQDVDGPEEVIFSAPNTENWPSVFTESVDMLSSYGEGRWFNRWSLPYALFDEEGNWSKVYNPPNVDFDNTYGGLQRWYFGFDVPDGEEFTLSAETTAGVKNLTVCSQENVQIEGTPYDDFVVRTVDPQNPFPAGVGINWQGFEHLITNLVSWYDEVEREFQKKIEKFNSGAVFLEWFQRFWDKFSFWKDDDENWS